MITQEYLKSILNYDPETGFFTWKVRLAAATLIDGDAGWYNKDGYLIIQIKGKGYPASHLAWLYVTGDWPKDEVDHENLIKSDNRWKNLREANRTENMYNTPTYKNNRLGIKGVGFHKVSGKFRARINVNGKSKDLGLFNTPEEAKEAYDKIATLERGKFVRL